MRRLVLAIPAALLLAPGPARGAICTVVVTTDAGAGSGDAGDLRYCVTRANASADVPHTISITATGTITLASPLPPLGRDVTIAGPGPASLTISGSGLHPLFFVGSPSSPDPTPAVTISDLTLAGGRARGFDGGEGGGGAAGMGGALVVNGGSVVVSNVTFSGNQSVGGKGGNGSDTGVFPGGGGGAGSAGANGDYSLWAAGGSGGPFGGSGGTAGSGTFGNGGAGGDGAGGGSGAAGGPGGVGGGGGGGSAGAQGGVGGGGGSGVVFGASGGWGGGSGASGDGVFSFGGGGGGAGLGGAVFVRSGSLVVAHCTFTGNSASGGAGGTGGVGTSGPGSGRGGAVFVHGGWLTLFGTSFSGNSDTTGPGSDGTGSCASPPAVPCDPGNVTVYGGTVGCTPPPPAVFDDGPVCEGATLHLSTPAFEGATYSWTGPNGFTSAAASPSIPGVTVASAGTYGVTVTAGGCTSAAGTTEVAVLPDPSAPSVTAPLPLTVHQTACCGTSGGVTGATSAALSSFLAGATATDDCDPDPAELPVLAGGVEATETTCFESGSTPVTFRFQDASGKVGSASSSVTVRLFGDLDLDGRVDPADMVVLQSFFNFAASPGTPPFAAPESMADLTHDAAVDPADMVQLQSFFNFAVACLAP
ncbi:MAG: hypothetical protein EDX89_20235 [Acidobacteria bacterium]|nr:MAG: hypothetical protein EDX89_20235 [Acidobacteriota bacterium]